LAQKALSAVYRTGQRFGVTYLVEVLMGRTNERMARAGHDKLAVFGVGKDTDETTWKGVYRQLTAAGCLSGDDDGYGTLVLTNAARPILRGEEPFRVRIAPKETRTKPKRQGKSSVAVAETDRPLFEALRALRLKLAGEAKLPPYIICTDVTLAELASARPKDEAALHNITGLGNSKIARYGAALLTTIATHEGGGAEVTAPDNGLSAAANQTLTLVRGGMDADAIAAHRQVDIDTVYDHFAGAIELGLIEARDVVGLDEEEIDEILGTFEELGTLDSGKLEPAHAALDERFDIGVLKCLLAELS
jgi:ATP-dependent DNA helicase RecQ